jgi:DNA invertase Pin-like site-specific DNA recombinase
MARRRDPQLAVAYRRVSTDDQANGLEAQTVAIEVWAERTGATVLAWYTDEAVSGGADLSDRPGLLDALADLRTFRAGTLVVAKRDRLARDVAVAAAVQRDVVRSGARVATADGQGDDSDLMRHILDAFAEHERGVISARTRAAMARKRVRGEYLGGRAPFGFDASKGQLEPLAHELGVITMVQAMRDHRVCDIVRHLELAGVKNRAGKPLNRTAVVRLLNRAGH